jgi:UDP-N-acetylglucosamine--N-acetylmuramyl-(pentapeptide) pyrophosphoryl-undecaprenol N-acetylglucosamine transferase
MNKTAPLILLAAGGTGGHLFPAEALGVELKKRGLRVRLATDSRALRYSGLFSRDTIDVVPSETVRSRNPLSLARTAFTLAAGMAVAIRLLRRLKPAAVVGFGGYPTLPPLIAARLLGIPSIIHDANAVLGRANRFLSGHVSAIATSLPGVLDRDPELAAKATTVGTPMRPAILAAAGVKYAAPEPGGPFRLLVTGGSQGARVMSDIVPGAIERLEPALWRRLVLTQQVREEDMARVRAVYDRLKIQAELAPFFSDLPARLASNHLVVSRSGAGTVAELAAIGRPSILVPLPGSIDQDQFANAGVLAQAGGALRIPQTEFSSDRLASEILALAAEPERLAAMAKAARGAGRLDAAERLADLVLTTAKLVDVPLTSFQVATEAALTNILVQSAPGELQREIVSGREETYVRVDIVPRGISFFLYSDGAQIQGKGLDKRFEIEDYASGEALQRSFLEAARAFV